MSSTGVWLSLSIHHPLGKVISPLLDSSMDPNSASRHGETWGWLGLWSFLSLLCHTATFSLLQLICLGIQIPV
jgi:hypothetical protein